jgi:branched-chain amino acid aminotransferase
MKYNFLKRAYLQERFVDFKDAKISVATHALHYGTAAFGGMRVQVRNNKGKTEHVIFRVDEHAKRLARSAIMLGAKPDQFTAEFIKSKIMAFVKENKDIKIDYYIRPLIYSSQLGLTPTLNAEKDFLIYGVELGDYLAAGGIKVCVSSFRRQEDSMIPTRGKISGGYYISAAAKAEATDRGFDDAIMLTNAGKVSEGSAMNVFMVRDGILVTPPSTEGILEGITRKSIIELAKSLKVEVVERQIDITELKFLAEEVFFTGTAAKITKCKQIESCLMPEKTPVCDKLQKELGKVFDGQNKKFSNWITITK